jgi:hypothetical protein
LRHEGLRFFFYSREEGRPHVHVTSADGEAKTWLEPELAFAWRHGIRPQDLSTAMRLAEEHRDDFRVAWERYFEG